MFGFFKRKRRPPKTFEISYVLSRTIDNNIVSFDKGDMIYSYIDCETIGEAVSIFAKKFFTTNRPIFIYGIEELPTKTGTV